MAQRYKMVAPGEWLSYAASDPNSLEAQYVRIDGERRPAFVDDGRLKIRMPRLEKQHGDIVEIYVEATGQEYTVVYGADDG